MPAMIAITWTDVYNVWTGVCLLLLITAIFVGWGLGSIWVWKKINAWLDKKKAAAIQKVLNRENK